MSEKLFLSRRIFLGDDDSNGSENFVNGGIVTNGEGKISRVLRSLQEVDQYKENYSPNIIDFGDKVIMPGLIDSHVHVNEPGRTDWEGFSTATKAAAAGGFTTIAEMPLNSIPPTTTEENLKRKIEASEGKLQVDVTLWGGIIPGNVSKLRKLALKGLKGFKCFLISSGIDEFPNVTRQDLEKALVELKGTNCVLLLHAELEPEKEIIVGDDDPTKFSTFLKTRPPSMEVNAIKMISELSQKYKDVKFHIVHLSASEALPIIKECRKNGGQLTVETCHHYLNFAAEDIPDRRTEFKCTPPIREKWNREKLWEAVIKGEIDLIASDHSPCTPDLKALDEGNFLKAWGGISSNQFGLSIFWKNCSKYSLGIEEVHKFLCKGPAKLCGILDRKGKISEGYDADFCVWNPDEQFDITPDIIHFKNKLTPYMNTELKGVVYATILRGDVIYSKTTGFSEPKGIVLI